MSTVDDVLIIKSDIATRVTVSKIQDSRSTNPCLKMLAFCNRHLPPDY